MNPQEFYETIRDFPAPKVNKALIYSHQELYALREFALWEQEQTDPHYHLKHNTSVLGIPVIIDSGVPEGIIRFMLNGEIVRDVTIR